MFLERNSNLSLSNRKLRVTNIRRLRRRLLAAAFSHTLFAAALCIALFAAAFSHALFAAALCIALFAGMSAADFYLRHVRRRRTGGEKTKTERIIYLSLPIPTMPYAARPVYRRRRERGRPI